MTQAKLSKTHRWPPALYERVEAVARAQGKPIQHVLDEAVEIGITKLEREVFVMTKEQFLANRNAVVGMAWSDVDAMGLDWRGYWPVVDQDGRIHSIVDGNYPPSEDSGIVYDEKADIYRIQLRSSGMTERVLAIMQGWDREAGIESRTAHEYEQDVAGSLGRWTWEDWLKALEANDPAAILEGRRVWGLPALV